MKPRITVVIITYKQQDLIKRALDSVLSQRQYGLKEIIISDDCSPDNTWEIVLEYSRQFPEFIRAHRNPINKGIYANMQIALSLVADTDLVLFLSGDDEYCDGYFKHLIEAIEKKHIDLNSSYSIFCDFKVINPIGQTQVIKHDIILKYPEKMDLISLKLRHLIYGRSIAISYETIKQFKPVPIDKGISYAENYFDIQPYLWSDKFYYFPYTGSVYYSSIGISTVMNNKGEYKVLENVYRDMQSLPIIKKNDIFYLKYLELKFNYLASPQITKLFKILLYYICSIKYPVETYKIFIDKVRNIVFTK